MRSNIFSVLDKIIEKKILLYSNQIDIKKIKILIAFSGGIDSSVLLHIVNKLSKKLRFKFDFVYINHNMNPNNKLIKMQAQLLSSIYNSNFIYREIESVPKKNKESLFREKRYNLLENLEEENKYNFIFTAHHFDDQLETAYMRTLGKYNWTNLFGIYEFRGSIRRPMLKIKKQKIIDYAIENNIRWIFDYTNNDSTILRNNIRNNIFPNKNILLFYYLRYLLFHSRLNLYLFQYRIRNLEFEIVKKTDHYILLKKDIFLKLSNNYKKIFFQKILKQYNNNEYLIIKKSKWLELWNYLAKDKNLNNFIMTNDIIINNSKDVIIMRKNNNYNKKIVLKNNVIWDSSIFKIDKVEFINDRGIDKNSTYMSSDILEKGIYIRNWNAGDYYLTSNQRRKKVSKLFIKNKFNNYQKMYHPILVDSKNRIIWVPGLINNRDLSIKSENNNYIKISQEILN